MDIQEFLYLTQSRLDVDVDGPDPNQIIIDIGILTPSRDRVNDCWANQQNQHGFSKATNSKGGHTTGIRQHRLTHTRGPVADLLTSALQ